LEANRIKKYQHLGGFLQASPRLRDVGHNLAERERSAELLEKSWCAGGETERRIAKRVDVAERASSTARSDLFA
jgi:hypothetical protein